MSDNAARAVLLQMKDEELEKMILHLGRYALRASNRLYWRTGNAGVLPGGETVESIVSLALEKAWTGERKWNPQLVPDIKRYLMDVIDSLLSHLASSRDNRILVSLPAAEQEDSSISSTPPERLHAAEWMISSEESAEEQLLRKADEERERKAIEMLLGEARDDPKLTLVIKAMLDGHERASEIAAATRMDVKDVYNAMKRLDRKIELVRKMTGELAA
jgi:hypothetical protein